MAGRQGFWGNLLGLPAVQRDRFSREELRYLHETLQQQPSVTANNKQLIIETLRSMAELLIWGDQHEPSFFDYFAEHNMLQHFTRIIQSSSSSQSEVAIQVSC